MKTQTPTQKPILTFWRVVFFAIMLAGYVWYLEERIQKQLLAWPPQLGLGFWFAAIGLVLFARGVFEVYEERRRRLY